MTNGLDVFFLAVHQVDDVARAGNPESVKTVWQCLHSVATRNARSFKMLGGRGSVRRTQLKPEFGLSHGFDAVQPK